jgi:hypothetical protein
MSRKLDTLGDERRELLGLCFVEVQMIGGALRPVMPMRSGRCRP